MIERRAEIVEDPCAGAAGQAQWHGEPAPPQPPAPPRVEGQGAKDIRPDPESDVGVPSAPELPRARGAIGFHVPLGELEAKLATESDLDRREARVRRVEPSDDEEARLLVLLAGVLAAGEHRGVVKLGTLPVPGAVVTARQGDKMVTALTDLQGAYVFPDLADGRWTIKIGTASCR